MKNVKRLVHQGAETVSQADEQTFDDEHSVTVQDKVKNITRLARLDLEAETVSQATDEQIFEGNDEQKGKSDG